jgi:hypothetical protein
VNAVRSAATTIFKIYFEGASKTLWFKPVKKDPRCSSGLNGQLLPGGAKEIVEVGGGSKGFGDWAASGDGTGEVAATR